MSIGNLKIAIEAMLEAHPSIEASEAGHATHANRYRTASGALIGWRSNTTTQQNIYVELDRIRLAPLKDIEHTTSDAATRTGDEPNANLFHQKAFSKDQDIVTFQITDAWQAARVIAEVAGLAP